MPPSRPRQAGSSSHQSLAGSAINQRFSRPGDYQLSVLDESGQTARLLFRVLD
jgi:hypothetical protein